MYASDEDLGKLERKVISFMQNDAKGKAETRKMKIISKSTIPSATNSSPTSLLLERRGRLCFVFLGMTVESSQVTFCSFLQHLL